jgi:hypothetical protein
MVVAAVFTLIRPATDLKFQSKKNPRQARVLLVKTADERLF